MKTATTHQTKTHLSRYLKEVQAGETIVILNGSVPVAKLTAFEPSTLTRPKAGTRTSEPVHYTEDAFQPLTNEELETSGL
jgi:antitoxin (DNA-binding transcriptional repressor) of toxin-antitoxin stability system